MSTHRKNEAQHLSTLRAMPSFYAPAHYSHTASVACFIDMNASACCLICTRLGTLESLVFASLAICFCICITVNSCVVEKLLNKHVNCATVLSQVMHVVQKYIFL